MSFTLYASGDDRCEHCGRSDMDGSDQHIVNVTHNVNNMVEIMFKSAGITSVAKIAGSYYAERSWGRWEGWLLKEIKPLAQQCLTWLNDCEGTLEHMNPENGWGSTKCLRRVLCELISAESRWPNSRLVVSG